MTLGAALEGGGAEAYSQGPAHRAHPCHTHLGVDVQPVGRLPFVIALLEPFCEEVTRDGLVRVSLTSKAAAGEHMPGTSACVYVRVLVSCQQQTFGAHQKSFPQWQRTPCSSMSVAMTALPHPGEGHHLRVRFACTKLFVIRYRYLALTDTSWMMRLQQKGWSRVQTDARTHAHSNVHTDRTVFSSTTTAQLAAGQ